MAGLMFSVNESDLDRITGAIHSILNGGIPEAIVLPSDFPENELKQLVDYVNALLSEYRRFAESMYAISRGELDSELAGGRMHVNDSLEHLQSNLRHVTWKTQQIAKGDFTQRVDFMGEFSESFNTMVEQLAMSREGLLRKNQELATVSRTDSLTGLLNRRGATEIIERESHRARRSNRPFVILIADLDRFKAINDTHGHAAGDAILVETAKVLLAHLRKGDVCARWRGEEFLVLLAEAELSQAVVVAERLRLAVASAQVIHYGRDIRFTISAGLSAFDGREGAEACLTRSDKCLYIAKESGRNQVWYETAEGEPVRVSGPPAGPSQE